MVQSAWYINHAELMSEICSTTTWFCASTLVLACFSSWLTVNCDRPNPINTAEIKIPRQIRYYPYNISFNANKAIKISEVRNYSSSEVSIFFLVVCCFLCLADAIPQGKKNPQQLQFTINASVVPNILVTNHKLHHYTAVDTIPLLQD